MYDEGSIQRVMLMLDWNTGVGGTWHENEYQAAQATSQLTITTRPLSRTQIGRTLMSVRTILSDTAETSREDITYTRISEIDRGVMIYTTEK
jgi:hypothetical protein